MVPERYDARLVKAANQIAASAQSLTRWESLKQIDVGQVHPVVIVWGPGVSQINTTLEIDGTVIVPGQAATRWPRNLPSGVLTNEQVEAAWTALDKQVRVRDPGEAALQPIHRPLSY